jgi:hypothetical protein
LRSLYYAIYTRQDELKAIWATKKVPVTTAAPRFGHNFLEENLNEAFVILGECQKALEDVREMWDKSCKVVEPEIATNITRKLRKIYAINRQSMDQVHTSDLLTVQVHHFSS